MQSFRQYLKEHIEYSEWMHPKEASKHITKAQFKTIGKHPDSDVYTSHFSSPPQYRIDKDTPSWHTGSIRHIQVHHPLTGHTIEWHISRKGKYYAHTIYKHHPANATHEHPYATIVKHRQID